MRLLGFDPQQVGTVLQAGDTVEDNTVDTAAFFEAEQTRSQTLRLEQFAVGLDDHVAVLDVVSAGDVVAVEEAVVLVAQVARFVGHSDLLGQASAQRVGTGNDYTVVHTQLQERVTNSVDLGKEVSVRNGDFTVLVTTLLLVGYLVFDLDTAGTGFNHLLGHQVGGFSVTETSVDVGNDRYNVGFEVVDLVDDFSFCFGVALGACGVQVTEQVVQFPRISLLEEGVQLADQVSNGGLLVHGLVRQRAELAAQSSYHPAGQVQVATLGGTEVLLDRNQLLLTDEAVPATQRLGVLGRILVVGSHVCTHDVCVVLGDVQVGVETVLEAHTYGGLRVDRLPGFVGLDDLGERLYVFAI